MSNAQEGLEVDEAGRGVLVPETTYFIGQKLYMTDATLEEVNLVFSALGHPPITRSDFFSTSQELRIAKPRQVCMWLLQDECKLSSPDIGNYLGGRNHATALYGILTIKREFKHNALLTTFGRNIRQRYLAARFMGPPHLHQYGADEIDEFRTFFRVYPFGRGGRRSWLKQLARKNRS